LEDKNSLETFYAVDGRAFTRLDGLYSQGSGLWEGWKMPRTQAVSLKTPANRLDLRFELSGDGAQLWSAPDARLRLEVEMASPGLAPLRPGAELATLRASQPVEVLLLPHPAAFPDRLRPDY
jgi:hypothetical protein